MNAGPCAGSQEKTGLPVGGCSPSRGAQPNHRSSSYLQMNERQHQRPMQASESEAGKGSRGRKLKHQAPGPFLSRTVFLRVVTLGDIPTAHTGTLSKSLPHSHELTLNQEQKLQAHPPSRSKKEQTGQLASLGPSTGCSWRQPHHGLHQPGTT